MKKPISCRYVFPTIPLDRTVSQPHPQPLCESVTAGFGGGRSREGVVWPARVANPSERKNAPSLVKKMPKMGFYYIKTSEKKMPDAQKWGIFHVLLHFY